MFVPFIVQWVILWASSKCWCRWFSLSLSTWILWCCRCFCRWARLCLFLPSEFSHFSPSYLCISFTVQFFFLSLCCCCCCSNMFVFVSVTAIHNDGRLFFFRLFFFAGGCTAPNATAIRSNEKNSWVCRALLQAPHIISYDWSCQILSNHCDDTLISLVLHVAPQFHAHPLTNEQVRNGRWPMFFTFSLKCTRFACHLLHWPDW